MSRLDALRQEYGPAIVAAELERFQSQQLMAQQRRTDECDAALALTSDLQHAIDERLVRIETDIQPRKEHQEALLYGAMQRALTGERIIKQSGCLADLAENR